MNSYLIEQATDIDFAPIIQLLEENNLPSGDIEPGKQTFYIARNQNQIIGCIGIEIYEQHGLLRSIATAEKFKNTGVGKNLYQHLISYSLKLNLQKLYLLTTTADTYFEKFGWSKINRNVMPLAIQKSKEFSFLCPSTAICMELSLLPAHASNIFAEGFNCAQSVFVPFAIQAGIAKETALKLATGFGAGMVNRGETCGAITGAMMAIGLNKGRANATDLKTKENTYLLINELNKKYIDTHGSILCKDLLEMENTEPESWAKAMAEGKFQTHCPNYVKDAARLTEGLINR